MPCAADCEAGSMAPRDRRPSAQRRFAGLITVGALLWVFSGTFFETPLAEATDSALATALAALSFLAAYGGAGMALVGLYRLLRGLEGRLGVDQVDQAPSSVVGDGHDPS